MPNNMPSNVVAHSNSKVKRRTAWLDKFSSRHACPGKKELCYYPQKRQQHAFFFFARVQTEKKIDAKIIAFKKMINCGKSKKEEINMIM